MLESSLIPTHQPAPPHNRYFAKNKLVFFQSQLSLHGFKLITTGKDANCYYHPMFLRGRQDLLPSLKKVKTPLTFTEPSSLFTSEDVFSGILQTDTA